MNILFIEDEKELATTGVEQLELRGYNVFSASSIEEARAIMDTSGETVNYIITDHRLEDGLGIQFILSLEGSFPLKKCAVVSGYLTNMDTNQLKNHGVLYFRKPLLYAKVMDELRRQNMKAAPVQRIEPVVKETASEEPNPTEETEAAEEPETVSEEPKKRKGLTLWPFKVSK